MDSKRFRLTFDEADLMAELLSHPGWEAFEGKVLARLLRDAEEKVLKYTLNSGPDGLVIEKARHEGVDWVVREVRKLKGK